MAVTQLTGFSAYRSLGHLLIDPLTATRKLRDGHGGFVSMSPVLGAGRGQILHVCGERYVEPIFRQHTVFHNSALIVYGYAGSKHNALRNGFFSANGAEYEHYLDLIGRFFRKRNVEDVYPAIGELVQAELAAWPTDAVVNVVPRVNRLMKLLASRCIFHDPDTPAGLHAADMFEQHGRLSGATIASVLAANLGRPPLSRLHRQAIATHAALVRWGETHARCPADADLLAAIVQNPDETGRPPHPDRIAAYGWTMLGASYDTQTSILAWLFVLLSTHPEVARRLHEEVKDLGTNVAEAMPAIMALPYLDAVIKEALRLVPPAPIQRRKVMEDTELAGIPVRAGSRVLVSAWMTNRDPDLYPDPERFRPERWEGMNRTPFQWLTFSAGPRRCLGIWFAYAFLKPIVASIMARWRPDIADGSHIDMKVAVTVRPGASLPVMLHPPDGRYRKALISGNVHHYLSLR
jgi:cytochrome P450